MNYKEIVLEAIKRANYERISNINLYKETALLEIEELAMEYAEDDSCTLEDQAKQYFLKAMNTYEAA